MRGLDWFVVSIGRLGLAGQEPRIVFDKLQNNAKDEEAK